MRGKKFVGLLILISSALAGCTGAVPSGNRVHSAEAGITPTVLPTFLTPYILPTQTPTSSSTPYPIFDANTVVTSTPFTPAECPPEDPRFEVINTFDPDTMPYEKFAVLVWEALDLGASLTQVSLAFDLIHVDLTGDEIAELVLYHYQFIEIIGCSQGIYTTLLEYRPDTIYGPSIASVQDMNRNGVPEVILDVPMGGARIFTAVDILEWDGDEFVSLIKSNHGELSPQQTVLARSLYWYEISWLISETDYSDFPDEIFLGKMNAGADISIIDSNGDSIKELVLRDHADWGPWSVPMYTDGPWRPKTVTFEWDGEHFLYSALSMGEPTYRFQTIQDADRFFLMGNYSQAHSLYRQAVFSDRLEWWSVGRIVYDINNYFAEINDEATPTPLAPDQEEISSLKAYARYRILLYHLAFARTFDAEVILATLLEENPAGSAGYPAAEMATILWNTYQENGELAAACVSVVKYAEANPTILLALGSEEHGQQSHIYEPIDVCPFADPLLSPPR